MFRDIRRAGTISLKAVALCCLLIVGFSVSAAEKPVVVVNQGLLRVEAPPDNEKYAESVLSHATAALRIVNDQAGEAMHIPITFEIIPTEKIFLQRAGGVGENSLAVSLGNQARVLISRPAMAESGSDRIRQVLVHELAHVYLDSKTAASAPRWVHEGVAQAMAGEWQDAPSDGRMAIAAYTGGLIPLRNLVNGFPSNETKRDLAYAQSYSVIRYLVRNDFGNSLALFLKAIRGEEGKDYLNSLSGGIHLESVDYRWRSELRHPRFLFTIVLSSGFLWGAAALLLLFAYVVKRRRSKLLRQQWAREEMLAAEYGSMTAADSKAISEKYGITFPTLVDTSGTIARAFEAKTTPHMFVINKEGNIVYDGALNDNPSPDVSKDASATNYVAQAVEAAVKGEMPATTKTKPYGCGVHLAKN